MSFVFQRNVFQKIFIQNLFVVIQFLQTPNEPTGCYIQQQRVHLLVARCYCFNRQKGWKGAISRHNSGKTEEVDSRYTNLDHIFTRMTYNSFYCSRYNSFFAWNRCFKFTKPSSKSSDSWGWSQSYQTKVDPLLEWILRKVWSLLAHSFSWCEASWFVCRGQIRGLLHDDNFTKAARPAKAAKPPDNFYFVL